MNGFLEDGRHRVAVLVRDGLLPIELGIVHRLFGQARSLAGDPLYEVLTCAVEPGEVRTDADFTITVGRGPDLLDGADTVVLPAAAEDYTPTGDPLPAPLAAALARIRPGTRVASICSGSFVLAAAGLLEGRRATTHWRSCADFARLHPTVRLEPDVLYTEDDGVLTSAGVANDVARGTVVPPHRDGGQAQYIPAPVTDADRESTAPARAWALNRLDRRITVADLAARIPMSERTFLRRFCAETGQAPLRWLNQQRVHRALELLESTDLPVEEVAAATGFGTATSLRQHLRATVGVSPSGYRATFTGRRRTGGDTA